MAEDVICVDGEIRTATREIEQYIETLVSCIAEYNACLRHVQIVGIEDEIIRSKLGRLSQSLMEYSTALSGILTDYKNLEVRMMNAFEKSDSFVFPNDFVNDLLILIKMFT